MRRTYHICLSNGDEVYCRDEEDYNYCFNSLAIAINETDSVLMADAIMSNHIHECVRTADPREVLLRQRYRYSRYFNAKYDRRGRLGERFPFITEVHGINHLLALISYILRNPLHHGLVSTPFAYPFSSINTYFRKDLGRNSEHLLLLEEQYYRHLPEHRKCPPGYRMDKNGLILREDVIDTAEVEHHFGSPRTFLYFMNRLSGEEWIREQEKDKEGRDQLITLELIEKGVRGQSTQEMCQNEYGRCRYDRMGDLEVCHLIDKTILPAIGRQSVYQLSPAEKVRLARDLCHEYRLPEDIVNRCLAMFHL